MKKTNRNFQKLAFQIISSAMVISSIYFAVQVIETFSHNWSINSDKYNEALTFTSKICSQKELIEFPDIYENCRQKKEILKRNPFWETIVDTSKLLHVCYKRKILHDENKIDGHDHLKKDKHENDDEIDCSLFTVFLIGIITAVIIIVYFLKFCKNKKKERKLKND